MDENELWERFAAGGKIGDYLEYRQSVKMCSETELKKSDKGKYAGTCDKGTDYRRV